MVLVLHFLLTVRDPWRVWAGAAGMEESVANQKDTIAMNLFAQATSTLSRITTMIDHICRFQILVIYTKNTNAGYHCQVIHVPVGKHMSMLSCMKAHHLNDLAQNKCKSHYLPQLFLWSVAQGKWLQWQLSTWDKRAACPQVMWQQATTLDQTCSFSTGEISPVLGMQGLERSPRKLELFPISFIQARGEITSSNLTTNRNVVRKQC